MIKLRSTMQISFYIVDAFVDPEKPFSGNPAAVVLLNNDNDISDESKQRIAAQFNLSETVFVSKVLETQTNGAQFLIRWFTPTTEVKLCGHATLAASHILYNEQHQFNAEIAKEKPLKFCTKFETYVQCGKDKENLVLNFPLNEPIKLDVQRNKWIDKLQREVLGTSGASLVDVQWSEETKKLLLVVESTNGEQILTQFKPDFNKLLNVDTNGMVRGVIVSQKANLYKDKVHFWSRYFTPWNGINEDPVTGSSFTVLVPYWKKVYQNTHDINVFYAKQVSQRSGLVQSLIVENRAQIGGKAKTFCKGTFQIN